jgi:3-deoxy-D-manno-octulosonic acid (KDO) 8-phosphate synthase
VAEFSSGTRVTKPSFETSVKLEPCEFGVALSGVPGAAEAHDDPDKAKSDPATVYPLNQLSSLLAGLDRISKARDASK